MLIKHFKSLVCLAACSGGICFGSFISQVSGSGTNGPPCTVKDSQPATCSASSDGVRYSATTSIQTVGLSAHTLSEATLGHSSEAAAIDELTDKLQIHGGIGSGVLSFTLLPSALAFTGNGTGQMVVNINGSTLQLDSLGPLSFEPVVITVPFVFDETLNVKIRVSASSASSGLADPTSEDVTQQILRIGVQAPSDGSRRFSYSSESGLAYPLDNASSLTPTPEPATIITAGLFTLAALTLAQYRRRVPRR